MQAELT